jgi:hypothetical protein
VLVAASSLEPADPAARLRRRILPPTWQARPLRCATSYSPGAASSTLGARRPRSLSPSLSHAVCAFYERDNGEVRWRYWGCETMGARGRHWGGEMVAAWAVARGTVRGRAAWGGRRVSK